MKPGLGPASPGGAGVEIVPWSDEHLPLLQALLGDEAMMAHLGGPESAEAIVARHLRYMTMTDPREGGVFAVTTASRGAAVAWVGYWERQWRGEPIYEVGWSTHPAHQRRGYARLATEALVARVAAVGSCRSLHAFPAVANAPSNAICRRLGFTLVEECEFEYPPGSFMRCNDWRLDLPPSA